MVKFRTVCLDPAWPEHGGEAKNKGDGRKGAQHKYMLSKDRAAVLESIISCEHLRPRLVDDFVVKNYELDGVRKNAHMYMWVTSNYMQMGFWIIERLGFTYKCDIVWDKKRMGIGQYLRKRKEVCLFATRGRGQHPNVYTDARDLVDVIEEARTEHSRKPDKFYDLVQARSYGPYLEMFARERRSMQGDDWTLWGNQAPGSKIVLPRKYNIALR